MLAAWTQMPTPPTLIFSPPRPAPGSRPSCKKENAHVTTVTLGSLYYLVAVPMLWATVGEIYESIWDSIAATYRQLAGVLPPCMALYLDRPSRDRRTPYQTTFPIHPCRLLHHLLLPLLGPIQVRQHSRQSLPLLVVLSSKLLLSTPLLVRSKLGPKSLTVGNLQR